MTAVSEVANRFAEAVHKVDEPVLRDAMTDVRRALDEFAAATARTPSDVYDEAAAQLPADTPPDRVLVEVGKHVRADRAVRIEAAAKLAHTVANTDLMLEAAGAPAPPVEDLTGRLLARDELRVALDHVKSAELPQAVMSLVERAGFESPVVRELSSRYGGDYLESRGASRDLQRLARDPNSAAARARKVMRDTGAFGAGFTATGDVGYHDARLQQALRAIERAEAESKLARLER